jgi:transcriptional regulator with XRE-family HTH domain
MSENIVKKTCKELDITQKELAARIKVHEETVSKWSRGTTPTPGWAIELFKLLKLEKKFNIIKHVFNEQISK